MKKGIVLSLILCLLLSMIPAGAISAWAQEKGQPLPAAMDAVQPEDEILDKDGEGTPQAKRITRIYFEIFKNGKWRKASSVTLAQGDAIPARVMHIYTGSSSHYTTVYNNNTSVVDIVNYEGYTFLVGGKPGTAKLTAHEQYYNKKATLKVKVTPAKVTDIELPSPYFEVPMGKIFNLGEHVEVLPSYAANKAVTYKSSNKKVATIDKNGYVTPKQFGTTTITIQSKQNKKVKIQCTIAVMEASYNPVEYRFVGIGQANYNGNATDLPSCYNDMVMMGLAYTDSHYNGVKIKDCTGYYNCTGNKIVSILDGLASSGADENDVTVFYYSGHGAASDTASYRGALCGVDGSIVPVETVRKYLDKVPGNVVVILDSCLSGQYIESKSAAGQKTLAKQYAQSVINTFAASTAKNFDPKALTDSPYASKYKIITACQPLQSSMGLDDYGIFTYFALAGMGLDADAVLEGNGSAVYTDMAADVSGDKAVSLKELYNYVEGNMRMLRQEVPQIEQVTMAWPMNDNFTVLAKN